VKAGAILRGVAGTSASVLLCALAALAQQTAPAPAAPTPAAPAKRTPAAMPPAQKPAAAGKAAAPQGSAAVKGTAASPEAEKSGKNRDPFRTLIVEKKSSESAIPLHLPPGKKGLVIEQLQLQGIARGLDGGWIAVVDNKTKRAYFLREKDELYNGVVSKVLPDRIVYEMTAESGGKKTTREIVRKLSGETDQ
jgi:hypothetical protein